MKTAEIKCCRCGNIHRIPIYENLKLQDISLSYSENLPCPQNMEMVNLSSILKINETLGEHIKKLEARLQTVQDFLETVFGEKTDIILLWKMSQLIERIESLKKSHD